MAEEETADVGERVAHQTTVIPPDQIGGVTRFYEKEFPDLDECVMVNVRSIAGMSWIGAEVVPDWGHFVKREMISISQHTSCGIQILAEPPIWSFQGTRQLTTDGNVWAVIGLQKWAPTSSF